MFFQLITITNFTNAVNPATIRLELSTNRQLPMPARATKNKVPLSEVKDFATALAKTIQGGEVIALIGELGAGKTTFTKALGKALGVKESIPSPTFVMMQEFQIPKRSMYLYHLDLYRTKNFSEVESLGITQWWTRPETVTVIEWADKIIDQLPNGTQIIYLYRDAKATQQSN